MIVSNCFHPSLIVDSYLYKEHVYNRAQTNGQKHVSLPPVQQYDADYRNDFCHTIRRRRKGDFSKTIDDKEADYRRGQYLAKIFYILRRWFVGRK